MFVRRLLAVLLSLVTATATVVVVTPTTAEARAPRTIKKIVRPVHRNGTPVKGYRVVREDHGTSYTCSGGSPVSVSRDVSWCGGTADGTIACWKSVRHTELCLRDPSRRTLVRVRYYGAFGTTRYTTRPEPMLLRLRKHGTCLHRLGGAWDTVRSHPDWIGRYGCTRTAVYGSLRRWNDAIDRSVNPWRVNLLAYTSSGGQRVLHDRVRRAVYVGTAK